MPLRRVVRKATGHASNLCQAGIDCDVEIPGDLESSVSSFVKSRSLEVEEVLPPLADRLDSILQVTPGTCSRQPQTYLAMRARPENSGQRAESGLSSADRSYRQDHGSGRTS
jgi:hypothetical protein